MKTNITIFTIMIISVWSCKPKFEDVEIKGGSADFSSYIAIGNSLTAGYADGTLYKSGQENSYPSMLAAQFKLLNSSIAFKQPLMADEFGGFHVDPINFPVKLILGNSTDCKGVTGLGPVLSTTSAPNPANMSPIGSSGPYQNMGVPGARVGHLLFSGYGNEVGLITNPASANPYFVRFASSPDATILADAMKSSPTFFTCWIGNNDVLLYATRGGEDPTQPITPGSSFAAAYSAVIDGLTAGGAKGALANIPDITSIPFFTTVAWNALEIDAATANSLTVIFGQVADAVNKRDGGSVGEQYRIKFNEGKNGFLVKTGKNAANPEGFRQLTEGEFILLSVNQNALKCNGYGSFNSARWGLNPDSLLVSVNPLDEKDVLNATEVAAITSATSSYNSTIASVAGSKGLALIDMKAFMADVSANGFQFDGVSYTTRYVLGGAFSLDGVHLTPRGYALAANQFIEGINSHYEAKIPKVNVNNYPGLKMP